jgi:hypothetical protein
LFSNNFKYRNFEKILLELSMSICVNNVNQKDRNNTSIQGSYNSSIGSNNNQSLQEAFSRHFHTPYSLGSDRQIGGNSQYISTPIEGAITVEGLERINAEYEDRQRRRQAHGSERPPQRRD